MHNLLILTNSFWITHLLSRPVVSTGPFVCNPVDVRFDGEGQVDFGPVLLSTGTFVCNTVDVRFYGEGQVDFGPVLLSTGTFVCNHVVL